MNPGPRKLIDFGRFDTRRCQCEPCRQESSPVDDSTVPFASARVWYKFSVCRQYVARAFCSQRKLIEGMPVLWFSYVDKINFLVASEVSRHMEPNPYDGMGLGWRALFENMALDACVTDLFYLSELADLFFRMREVSRTGKAAASRVWLGCAVFFCSSEGRRHGLSRIRSRSRGHEQKPIGLGGSRMRSRTRCLVVGKRRVPIAAARRGSQLSLVVAACRARSSPQARRRQLKQHLEY